MSEVEKNDNTKKSTLSYKKKVGLICLVVLVLVLTMIFVVIGIQNKNQTSENLHARYAEHVLTFGIRYDESDANYTERLQNFNITDQKIKKHNSKNFTWTMGHNKFSDWHQSEIDAILLLDNLPLFKMNGSRNISNHPSVASSRNYVPLDWRTSGAVTPVMD